MGRPWIRATQDGIVLIGWIPQPCSVHTFISDLRELLKTYFLTLQIEAKQIYEI